MSKDVFVYMRYSSNMQNDYSIKAQLRAIKEFCGHNGYNIVKEYADKAHTATNDKRPEFQQMIKEAAQLHPYAVIVHKLDRFSRDKYDSVFYKSILEKNGVKLISVTEQLKDDPESRMLEGILFAMNQYYSDNLAREVEKGKKEIAYKCYHTGGLPPYGYDVGDDRKYIINDKESKAVKVIFDMYIHDYSYQQIAEYLNKRGYRTKKGNLFNRNSFSSILENGERYTGIYMYNRAASKYSDGTRNSHKYKADSDIIKIKDGIPRIITDDIYNKALQKMQFNKNNAGIFHSKRYYLLNGLIYCGECGKPYSGNTSRSGRSKQEYSTYRCTSYRCGCKNKDININYINYFVLDMLTNEIFSQKNYERMLSAFNAKYKKSFQDSKSEIISSKNELVQFDGKLNKLTDLLIESDNPQSLLDKIQKLETDKEKLLKKINNLESLTYIPVSGYDIDMARKYFKKYILKYDLPMFRKFIRTFVDRIDVYYDRAEVKLKTSD